MSTGRIYIKFFKAVSFTREISPDPQLFLRRHRAIREEATGYKNYKEITDPHEPQCRI